MCLVLRRYPRVGDFDRMAEESDVRFSIGEKLRLTTLVTDGRWDDAEARHETIDIVLGRGAVAAPERNRRPAALLVVPEADDGASQALLNRAVVRVLPGVEDLPPSRIQTPRLLRPEQVSDFAMEILEGEDATVR